MAEYHVSWEIELDAESALDAARGALEMQRDPESTATVFTVRLSNGPSTEVDIDLE